MTCGPRSFKRSGTVHLAPSAPTAPMADDPIARAAFACRRTLPAAALRLAVDGVGRVPLPVSARRAKALVAAGSAAPFGLGERTLVDPSVRNVTEIDAARVTVDEARWHEALDPALDGVRESLGLPSGRLVARLHKLLVYGPGSFFLPHRDTERDDSMVGTLVVVLPAPHRGGALTVEHGGRTRRFVSAGASPDALVLLAFYGDCLHEVKRVTEGHRIVLSHELHFEPAETAGASGERGRARGHDSAARGQRTSRVARADTDGAAREDALLERVLPRYFDAGGTDDERAPRRRLVYLLDHGYSQGSLDWRRLKGDDGDWARALRRVAARLDLRAWLALVTIHETWSTAGGDRWYDREHRYGYGHDDEEEDEPGEGFVRTEDGVTVELVELIEDGRTLECLRDARGRRRDWPPMSFDEDELCHPERALEPDETTYEGWMGNYGDTLERRYHRAAVVLWPEREHWRNLLDAGERALLGELLTVPEERSEDALAGFLMLGDAWPPRAWPSRDAEALAEALALAARWDDPAASLRLLGGFGLDALERRHVPALARLGASRGAEFANAVIERWFDPAPEPSEAAFVHRARAAARAALTRLPLVPALCKEVREIDALPAWGETLERLLVRLLSATLDANAEGRRAARASHRRAAIEPAAERWRALLDAAAALDRRAFTARIADALIGDMGRAPPAVGIALAEHLAARDDVPLGRTRAKALRRAVRTRVREGLAEAERADDDWSLAPLGGCGCTHCRALDRFLKNATARTLEVKDIQEKRGHVEQRLAFAELPVEATTLRRGSPHTLVLTKREALFDEARREADALRAALARLDELDGRGSG